MIDIKVFNNKEDIELLRTQWNSLLENSATNYIYSTPEWVESWYEAYGYGSEIRIIAAFKNKILVGLLPIIIRKAPLTDLGGKRIEFVSGRQGDYHDFIVGRGLEESIIPILLENMFNSSTSTNFIVFHHVVKESFTVPLIYNFFHKKKYKINTLEETAPYLCLDSSKEGIEKAWSKKHTTDLRRQIKRLHNLGKLEFKICSEKEKTLILLSDFFETHKNNWESRGYKSRLGYDNRTQTFFRKLILNIGCSEDNKRIHFSTLNLDGKPISYHFGFLYNNHFYYYIPTYNKNYENYSPGKIHLFYLIEHGIDKGWKLFDFLIGDEPYKYFWTKDDRKVITVIASRGISLSSLRRWWLVEGKAHTKNLIRFVKI